MRLINDCCRSGPKLVCVSVYECFYSFSFIFHSIPPYNFEVMVSVVFSILDIIRD